jgi:hypothetical protein
MYVFSVQFCSFQDPKCTHTVLWILELCVTFSTVKSYLRFLFFGGGGDSNFSTKVRETLGEENLTLR